MEQKMTGMDYKIREVAQRIRELREVSGFTVEEIATAETATACVESIQQEAGEDGFTLENILWINLGVLIGSVFAAIPGLILDIVFIVSVIFVDNGGVSSVLSACAWMEFLWNAPVAALYIVTQIPYVYLASTLLPVLFAGIAYYCGTKEFAIFGIPQKKR